LLQGNFNEEFRNTVPQFLRSKTGLISADSEILMESGRM